VARRLERSIMRDYWLGRGRFSKAAMSRRMTFSVPIDSGSAGAASTETPKGDSPVEAVPAHPIKEGL